MARHFTKDEIDEIRTRLATGASKDSELPEASTITNDDLMAIVQSGSNKRLAVVTLEEHIRQPYASDEATRQANEAIRQANENTRQTNESSRQGNEATRRSSETTRQTNETTRQSNEASRVAAEGTVVGRTGRAFAESQRVEAESARVTAENARHEQYTADHTRANNDHDASVAATAKASNVNATLSGATVTITDQNGVSRSIDITFDIYKTYGSVALMNADAANVDEGKFVLIATTDTTSTDNAKLFSRNSNPASSENPFTFLCDLDQAASTAWADWFNNYKPTIEADHTRAENDHTTASSDHTTAWTDHTTANNDHTRANTDHSTAASDHSAAETATTRANAAAAAAEHMVDIKTGPQGPQGNTGSSIDYPYELVNNLTTDDSTKGLSAAQGKVLDEKVSQLGQEVIYDVTANNADAKFASLSALLSSENLSTLIPIAIRCGGMSIRFVQSSDNKYVQYFYMSSDAATVATFTNVANWSCTNTSNAKTINDVLNTQGIINISKSEHVSYTGDATDSFYALYGVSIGDTFNLTIGGGIGYTRKILDVTEGDVFIINTTGNTSNAQAYAVLNASNVVLVIEQSAVNKILTIPANGAKLIVNTKVKNDFLVRIFGKIDTLIPVDTPNDLSKTLTTKGVIATLGNNNTEYFKQNKGYFINLTSATIGSTYNVILNQSSGYTCEDIPVKEGDVFGCRCTGTTSAAKAFTILNNSGEVLVLQSNCMGAILVMPTGADRLLVNTSTNNNPYLYKILGKEDEDYINLYNNLLYHAGAGEDAILTYTDHGCRYYNNLTSAYAYSDSWDVSDVIHVGKGSIITVKAAYEKNMGLILGCNAQGNVTDVLLVGTNDTADIITNTYTLQEDKYIRVARCRAANNETKISMWSGTFTTLTAVVDSIVELPISLPTNRNAYIPTPINLAVGDYLSSVSVTGTSGYTYYLGRVMAGDKYHIKTSGNTQHAKSYVVTDNQYKVVSFSQSGGEHDITIAEDGWMIVCTNTSNYELTFTNWYEARVKKFIFDTIKASVYDIARHNNEFRFDYAQIDSLYAGSIRLGYERNLPRKGSAINTDVDITYAITDDSTEEQVTKRCVPYLYWNQEKIGTIVLYDESTGKPYIYNKEGNKIILATE